MGPRILTIIMYQKDIGKTTNNMANNKTGAQRYNDRMDRIFARSKELNEKYHGKDSFGSKKKEVAKKMAKKMNFHNFVGHGVSQIRKSYNKLQEGLGSKERISRHKK